MERTKLEILSSTFVILISILTIIIYIYFGCNALFYVFIIIALLSAFFNAWYISNPEKAGHEILDLFGIRNALAPRKVTHAVPQRKGSTRRSK